MHRLNKISQAHRALLKRRSASEQLRTHFVRGLVSFATHHLREDAKAQALLVWVGWLALAALFYSLKMEITFLKGMYCQSHSLTLSLTHHYACTVVMLPRHGL